MFVYQLAGDFQAIWLLADTSNNVVNFKGYNINMFVFWQILYSKSGLVK